MNRIVILILEDEPEVRQALEHDLEPFAEAFRLESAETTDEAAEVVAECAASGDRLGLILCDHRLPGRSGVDYLVELHDRPATRDARKVLVTGQADHQDTIRAVNSARLNHYIAKPWEAEWLRDVVRHELTQYVLAHVRDLLPFVRHLDSARLMEEVARRAADT